MLAILGNLANENIEKVLEQLWLDINSLDVGELTKGRYLWQLRVLLELRNVNKEILKNMALAGEIFKEEEDILYIRGEHKGEHKKALEVARNLNQMGVPIPDIAKATGLSIKEVEAL